MRRIIVSFVILPLMASTLLAQWQKSTVSGYIGWSQETKISDARNDGIKRIYVASAGSHSVYEFYWNGSSWTEDEVGTNTKQIRDIFPGKGRNDDVTRIYETSESDTLFEYTWSESLWQKEMVGPSLYFGGAVAYGRNDGINRIYTPAEYPISSIYEITWTDGVWVTDKISAGSSFYGELVSGSGRNDDQVRIYAINWDKNIYEFSWSEADWIVDTVDTEDPGYVNDLAIGAGRNDGINRLYAGGGDGYLYEFSWNGSAWEKSSEFLPEGSTYMREVEVGNGRNDGIKRVYCAGNDTGLVELSWNGNDWTVDYLGPEYDGLTIGDGRDDGIMRVYAVDNSLVEYTYGPSGIENEDNAGNLPGKIDLFQNYPNPFNSATTIRFSLTLPVNALLQLYNINGQKIATLVDEHLAAGDHQFIWNADNIPSGIYLYNLQAGTYSETKKLLLIK